MKFKLLPDNNNCDDSVLIYDLKETAKKLNKKSLSSREYDKYGRFSVSTLQNRFGSWNQALEKCGLKIIKEHNVSEKELLEDLRNVAKNYQPNTITSTIYEKHGKYCRHIFSKTFGSWNNAMAKANLTPKFKKKNPSKEELYDNLATVWEATGRQPRESDLKKEPSRFSCYPYLRLFGSWRKTLVSFVDSIDRNPKVNLLNDNKTVNSFNLKPEEKSRNHKTPRNVSWRLRFLIMKRDNFVCCICGASPAKNLNVELHVDHKLAWSKGGETVIDNLQTLCQKCNIGKSDL